jgi:hypothetical protein
MVMTELSENKYGVEQHEIPIRKIRIFRLSNKWLVEYQRVPRTWAPWDYFWWYNDGQYVDYYDAIGRVHELKACGHVTVAQFQKVKTFEVEQ